jgi:hypothetical protein
MQTRVGSSAFREGCDSCLALATWRGVWEGADLGVEAKEAAAVRHTVERNTHSHLELDGRKVDTTDALRHRVLHLPQHRHNPIILQPSAPQQIACLMEGRVR